MATSDILVGDARDCLAALDERSVQCVVTSPPYFGLRDYGVEGQIGAEPTPEGYVAEMVAVFREVRRVLKDDGVLWLNLGDSYAGSGKGGNPEGSPYAGFHGSKAREQSAQPNKGKSMLYGAKPKDLLGIPWRVAFALQADGWYLRSDIIWHKPNPMPESVRDRPTKAHEYLFLLSKSVHYYYDADAIKEQAVGNAPGNKTHKGATAALTDEHHRTKAGLATMDAVETRNKRDVWTVTTQPFRGAHFAVMPEKLVEPCVLAGSAPGDVVMDPFTGSGTVGVVALHHGRDFVGVELNPTFALMAEERIAAGSRKLGAA